MSKIKIPDTTVLLIRPHLPALSFDYDVDIYWSPVIKIRPKTPKLNLKGIKGIAITSTYAVRTVRNIPFYCAGEKATQHAMQAGCNAYKRADYAEELKQNLEQEYDLNEILYLRGQHTTISMPNEAIVYDQQPMLLSKGGMEKVENTKNLIVPLYSKRSAEIFSAQVTRKDLTYVAISHNVASVVGTEYVAQQSNEEGMNSLLNEIFSKMINKSVDRDK